MTYGFLCQDCHNGRGRTAAATTAYHVNGYVELNISKTLGAATVTGTFSSTYSVAAGTTNDNLPGDYARAGWCDNVYCHSNGVEIKGMAATYQTVDWNDFGTLTCSSCHGTGGTSAHGEPDYASGGAGSASANSHEAHIGKAGLNNDRLELHCSDCHSATVVAGSDYISAPTINAPNGGTHVNGVVDVSSASFTLSYNVNGQKKCYSSCHGTYNTTTEIACAPQWGGGSKSGGYGSCQMCHDVNSCDPEDVVRPKAPTDQKPAGTAHANKIDFAQYTGAGATGHGLDSASTYAGGINAGAGLIWTAGTLYDPFDVGTADVGCLSTSGNMATPGDGCHSYLLQSGTRDWDKYKSHYTAKPAATHSGDDFFLGSSFQSNIDALCEYCHDGVTAPGLSGGNFSHTKGTTGSALTWPYVPKCVDCHDPHGDGNDYMIKYAVSRDYGSLANGNPALSDLSSPNLGSTQAEIDLMLPVTFNVDQVTGFDGGIGKAGDYYQANPTTNGNGICQVCHTQNLVYDNEAISGTATTTHQNWLDAALNSPFDTDAPVQDFLSPSGRRCSSCHKHFECDTEKGFPIPKPNPPCTPAPYCSDCHVWNPNGDTNHPLMTTQANGGLNGHPGFKDPTGQNDDIDDYTFGTTDFTNRAMIDGVQWTSGGHGTATSVSLPETSKGINAGPQHSCTPGTTSDGCHDSTVLHGDAGNPFRLLVYNAATGGAIINELCSNCHPPPTLAGVHKRHANGKTPMFEAGQCTDCHDPHGESARTDAGLTTVNDADLNAAMIQRELVWRDRWTAGAFGDPTDTNPVVVPADDKLEPVVRFYKAGGLNATAWDMKDYVTESSLNSGVCEACHTADTVGEPETQFFRRKNADGSTEASLPSFHKTANADYCTASCHTHVKGFEKPDLCSCLSCHAGVDRQFAPVDGSNVSSGPQQHDIVYNPPTSPPSTGSLDADCNTGGTVDCLKCHDLDTNGNHMDTTVYLKPIDSTKTGASPLTSPSAYAEAAPMGTAGAQSIGMTVWGNIRSDSTGTYETGEWCRSCHDLNGPPSAASTNLNGNAVAPPNIESDSSGAARFTTTGHGAQSGANLPRVAPNPATNNGRAACTGCHNYHGSDNVRMIQRAAWNGSAWQKWNGVNVPEPLDTSAADYVYNGNSTTISSVELFCLESCHVVDSFSALPPEPSLDFSDVITARGGATTKRAHYVFDYVGGNLGADYDAHNDTNFYFSGKAVGFVLGGTAGTPWNDLDTSDGNPATQNHTYINDSSKGESAKFTTVITSTPSPGTINSIFKAIWYNDGLNKGRAICVTCHDPHGSNVDATWGLPNKSPSSTDDNMLRGAWINGTAWGADADEPCDSCHK